MTSLLFERMLSRCAPLFHRFNQHPLQVGLYNETLPRPLFIKFLEQDVLYLRDYSKGVMHIARRLNDRRLSQQFKDFAEKTIQSELNLEFRYLQKERARVYTLFSKPPLTPNPKIPVIAAYGQHLLYTAFNGTIEEAIASHMACPLMYNRLGIIKKGTYSTENYYAPWLNGYHSKEFTRGTLSLTDAFNELASTITCPGEQEKIIRRFCQSAQFEVAFCSAIFKTYSPLLPKEEPPSFQNIRRF